MDERESRVGVNEALFRVVNERLEELNEPFSTLTGKFEIVCECGDPICATKISIARDAYERVRTEAKLFLVAPGHEDLDIEDVVEERDNYRIVRKHPGVPERVAEQTDPRH